jgi:hypothetical protein
MLKAQQKSLLLSSLSGHFAKNPAHRVTLRELVNGSSNVSLRIIDWFVTHYARQKEVMYWIDDKGHLVECHPNGSANLTRFHLYLEYRTQLKSYTKLHFDPFRRHERITFVVETQPNMLMIETTVGQLNFFRWAIQNRVIEYIQRHLPEIEGEMQMNPEHAKKGGEHAASKLASSSTPAVTDGVKKASSAISKTNVRLHFD